MRLHRVSILRVPVPSGRHRTGDLNAEEELATVLEVIDGGYHEEQCSTEVLHKIELLQASLAKAHERLTKGFTAQ